MAEEKNTKNEIRGLKPEELEKQLEECEKPSFVSSFAKATADKKATEGEQKESMEELKKKLEDCQKKSEEYLAGWQRARADFLNYKKEEMERFGEILKYANEEIILKILPILDNFEIVARQNFPAENLSGREEKIVEGFLQIKIQIVDFLKQQGVEEIKAVGEMFNPEFYEVVEEIEPSSAKATEGKEIKSGTIIEEIQKGYTINGRLLRAAKVKISK